MFEGDLDSALILNSLIKAPEQTWLHQKSIEQRYAIASLIRRQTPLEPTPHRRAGKPQKNSHKNYIPSIKLNTRAGWLSENELAGLSSDTLAPLFIQTGPDLFYNSAVSLEWKTDPGKKVMLKVKPVFRLQKNSRFNPPLSHPEFIDTLWNGLDKSSGITVALHNILSHFTVSYNGTISSNYSGRKTIQNSLALNYSKLFRQKGSFFLESRILNGNGNLLNSDLSEQQEKVGKYTMAKLFGCFETPLGSSTSLSFTLLAMGLKFPVITYPSMEIPLLLLDAYPYEYSLHADSVMKSAIDKTFDLTTMTEAFQKHEPQSILSGRPVVSFRFKPAKWLRLTIGSGWAFSYYPDQAAWFTSAYSSDSLSELVNSGYVELRLHESGNYALAHPHSGDSEEAFIRHQKTRFDHGPTIESAFRVTLGNRWSINLNGSIHKNYSNLNEFRPFKIPDMNWNLTMGIQTLILHPNRL